MKKFILILLTAVLHKCTATQADQNNQSRPIAFEKTYYTLCHRGVEYITRQYGESSFTLAVDKNNRPIQCKEN